MSDINPDNCSLTRFPAPVLGRPARPIDKIDDSIIRLAGKMIDVMVQSNGVGLAGPQLGIDLRIFVVSPDGTKENAKVYINPEIELWGGLEANEEGCLSLPGIYSKIKRHKNCTVTATGLDGNRFTEHASGLLVRAFQHEYDHLEGVLIKDRMGQAARIAARRKLRQMEEDFQNNRD